MPAATEYAASHGESALAAANNDAASVGELRNTNWSLAEDAIYASDWLFVCQLTDASLAENIPAERLYWTILQAMGLIPEETALLVAVDNAAAETMKLEEGWQRLLSRVQPQQVVILGHSIAEQLLQSEMANATSEVGEVVYPDGQARLVVSHSLEEMLSKPMRKASLWQQVCAAGFIEER